VILAGGEALDPEHLILETPASTPNGAGTLQTLADLERDAIVRTLDAFGGNRKDAAERLGIGLRTLYDKLKRYRLE
jgi:two-component system response regulator FlrC